MNVINEGVFARMRLIECELQSLKVYKGVINTTNYQDADRMELNALHE